MVDEKKYIDEIWKALESVLDPEIPALSVVDLGIIRNVEFEGEKVSVTMTPTFVGCPAIDVMKNDIIKAVKELNYEVEVHVDFKTPWSTNLMSDDAREKLKNFGLGVPVKFEGELDEEYLNKVSCPHCGSSDTTLNSPFGSTLCRAIRFCFSCKQGFEQFKPL